jgi:RNA polymerase sigma-32 factor
MHWIKAEIHEYIVRNWRLVKIATTKAQRKLFFNLRSMKQDSNTLNREEVRSIATRLGVKPEEVVEMESRFSGHEVPLEGNGSDDGESGERFAPISWLPDTNAEPSVELEQAQSARLQDEGLHQALDALDARSRDIVSRRWLTEGDAATLHELADKYGVSAERIRQIEARAMQKMRVMLAPAVT